MYHQFYLKISFYYSNFFKILNKQPVSVWVYYLKFAVDILYF